MIGKNELKETNRIIDTIKKNWGIYLSIDR